MIQKYGKILLILVMLAVICGTASAAMGIAAEPHETSGMDAPACSAPCECISLTQAMQRWGADGYDYCSKTVCGQSANAMVQYYCLHQSGSSAAAAPSAQAPASAAPASAGAGPKSPAGIATVIAALGAVMLAGAVQRRK
jgi:hypothetical protein